MRTGRTVGGKAVYKTTCETCNGDGFYFRLPSGMNPFLSDINQIARMTRKVWCSCGAAQPAPNAPAERFDDVTRGGTTKQEG